MHASNVLKHLKETYKVSDVQVRKDSNQVCLGISYQQLELVAKHIYQGDYHTFLTSNSHDVYELNVIQTKVIGMIKDFDEAFKYFNAFIPHANEWSLVDGLCQNFKITSKHHDQVFTRIETLSSSQKPFENRIAIVMLLSHFVNDTYVHRSLTILKQINSDHYYVKMAIAWALQVYAVHYPNEVKQILASQLLNPWVQNKAIQKIKESFRISDTYKDEISQYKVKRI